MKRVLLPVVLAALAIAPLSGQAPGKSSSSESTAKAESSARASATKNETKTHSVSQRVVVVNGKTIVDEKRVNGKLVSGRGGDKATPKKRLGKRPSKRLEELGAGATSTNKSTHTHRVLVVNGKVVVDEETRDGKPVNKPLK